MGVGVGCFLFAVGVRVFVVCSWHLLQNPGWLDSTRSSRWKSCSAFGAAPLLQAADV